MVDLLLSLRRLRRIALRLAVRALVLIGKLLKPRPRLAIFGARKGEIFGDCPAILIKEMSAAGFSCVWLTRNEQALLTARRHGYRVHMQSSILGQWYASRAGLAVISSHVEDVFASTRCRREDVRIVFTGHGKSIKKSGLSAQYHDGERMLRESTNYSFLARRTVLAFALSTQKAKTFAQSYGVDPTVVKVIGYPRHDELWRLAERSAKNYTNAIRMQEEKKILYAPTWRNSDVLVQTSIFGYPDRKWERLCDVLDSCNARLLIRPHVRDRASARLLSEYQEIRALTNRVEWIDPIDFENKDELIAECGVYITDYSSIEDDFLILDRPILYAPYDYADFEKGQGFADSYCETRAGFIAWSFGDLVEELRATLLGADRCAEVRQRKRAEVHAHRDGKATTRALSHILAVAAQKEPRPGFRSQARYSFAPPCIGERCGTDSCRAASEQAVALERHG